MSYDICIWDPYAFARPQDYIPTDLAEAENIRFALDWDEDEHLTDPRPMLPENPKFSAFLADLQELAKQERFSATFRRRYEGCATTALEDAQNRDNIYMTLPAPYRSDETGEHILALYELVQRHRLVMFDQDHWLVICPDGSTFPKEARWQLPRLQQQLHRLKQEHLTYSVASGQLPQQIQTFADHFMPIIDAYFAGRGCQRQADSEPAHFESSSAGGVYIKQTKVVIIKILFSIEGSLGQYRAYMKATLFSPPIDAYLQHVKDTEAGVGSHRFEVKDDRLHHQLLKQPSDIQAYLMKCEQMLDFLDQLNDLEQLLELWLRPDPFNPDAKANQSTNSDVRLYARLDALVLMRLINKPEKYAPIIEQSYQYALTCTTLEDRPGVRSKRHPKKTRREVFFLDWATLTELLDRDYPPSAD